MHAVHTLATQPPPPNSYSLLWRGIESEVVSLCLKHNIGILPWGPLGQGLLAGKFASPDDVPPGRARTRLFSNKRPQQRHGEPGLEGEQELESGTRHGTGSDSGH